MKWGFGIDATSKLFQAAVVVVPFCVYLGVYYAKYCKFSYLGVDPSLITIRFEDALLVVAVFLLSYTFNMVCSLATADVLGSGFRYVVILLTVVLFGSLLGTFIAAVHVSSCYDWDDALTFLDIGCAVMLGVGIVFLIAKKRIVDDPLPRVRIMTYVLLFFALALVVAGNCRIRSVSGTFQMVGEKLLVVDARQDGRGIVKDVASYGAQTGVITVRLGYQMVDLSGMGIDIVTSSFIAIEAAEE